MSDLLKINVNEHTEQKNGLTYLSWAWAWAEALKFDPDATFTVQQFGDKCYMEVNGTAMVWVSVRIKGKSMMCQLPVMDNKNRPITIDGTTTKDKYGKEVTTKLDSFNVNTAIMRCMTKALSLHGLGLYIYAGEDLPEADKPEPADVEASIAVLKSAKDVEALNLYWRVEVAKFDAKGEDYKKLKAAAAAHKSFLQEMAVTA